MSDAPSVEQAIACANAVLMARGFPPLDPEQVAVLKAQGRPAEAIGMLDELRDRVVGISHAVHRIGVEAVLGNTRLTAEQRAFVEARLLQIVNTVGAHVVRGEAFYPGGPVPPPLTSFAELHDYCDANELGGLCDESIMAEGNRLFPGRSDSGTLATQQWMEFSDRVQALADEWIVAFRSVFRRPEWYGRTRIGGQYREALPGFGPLDVELPVGWWDVTGPNDGCPNFACGHYRLWVGRAEIDKRDDTARFILELLNENIEPVRTILATDDWIAMEACIASLPASRDYLAMELNRAAA